MSLKAVSEQDFERWKLYNNDKAQQNVKKDLHDQMELLSEAEPANHYIPRFFDSSNEFPGYKAEKDKIHFALFERNVEQLEFSSPFYRDLDTAMKSINQIGRAIGKVEEVAGKAIEIACDTPVTSGFCKVVGSTVHIIGQAAVEAIPTAVKEGAEKLTTHLEKNGISRETTHETGVSLVRIGSVVAGGTLLKKGLTTSVPKPKYPLAGRLNNVVTKQDTPVFFIREAKQKAAQAFYRNAIEMEQKLLPILDTITVNRPSHFPMHLNKFYKDCNVHYFKLNHLGPSKKGILEGHILYSDNGLFLIKSRVNSSAINSVTDKLNSMKLLESTNLYWDQRLGFLIDEIKRIGQEKGFGSVYLAWNPEKNAVLTTLTHRSEPILSTTTLSTGIHATPLTVVEIALP